MARTVIAAMLVSCVVACADVYGPADVTLELRMVETAEGSNASSSEGIFSMRDGVHSLFDVFAYRTVDTDDLKKEPVQTIVRGSETIQPMPGILVELTMRYVLIEDCAAVPQVVSETNYLELAQIGVKSTGKGCSPPLTPQEQVGDARPNCLLFDGPEDNGKSVLVRTGPHGTLQFDMVPRLPDPFQGWIFEVQVRSGGGAAGISMPDDVANVCPAASNTATATGGTAAARPSPRFFDPPIRRPR